MQRLFCRSFAQKTIKGPLKNEQIQLPQVVLVDENNNKQGPMSPSSILSTMNRRFQDLVLVNPTHSPPLVKIISRSEVFRKQQSLEDAARLLRLRQREKEVRFGTSMANRDFEMRFAKVQELLEKAWRVRIVVEGKGIKCGAWEKEQMQKTVLERLKNEMGKDLMILAPPEIGGSGSLITTVQSASAKPSLANKREHKEKEVNNDRDKTENDIINGDSDKKREIKTNF